MPYSFSKAFKKTLAKKPAKMQGAILECIARLDENPRHPGLNVHKMQGFPGVWEAYVTKGDRVTFERDGETLKFRMNCNHDILRNP